MEFNEEVLPVRVVLDAAARTNSHCVRVKTGRLAKNLCAILCHLLCCQDLSSDVQLPKISNSGATVPQFVLRGMEVIKGDTDGATQAMVLMA